MCVCVCVCVWGVCVYFFPLSIIAKASEQVEISYFYLQYEQISLPTFLRHKPTGFLPYRLSNHCALSWTYATKGPEIRVNAQDNLPLKSRPNFP